LSCQLRQRHATKRPQRINGLQVNTKRREFYKLCDIPSCRSPLSGAGEEQAAGSLDQGTVRVACGIFARVACKPLPEALHFGSVNLAKQYVGL
jgi:hypothetical protein